MQSTNGEFIAVPGFLRSRAIVAGDDIAAGRFPNVPPRLIMPASAAAAPQ